MPEQNPATQTVTISDVKKSLSGLVNEVYRGNTRILVEKSGIPAAALVSVADLHAIRKVIEHGGSCGKYSPCGDCGKVRRQRRCRLSAPTDDYLTTRSCRVARARCGGAGKRLGG